MKQLYLLIPCKPILINGSNFSNLKKIDINYFVKGEYKSSKNILEDFWTDNKSK